MRLYLKHQQLLQLEVQPQAKLKSKSTGNSLQHTLRLVVQELIAMKSLLMMVIMEPSFQLQDLILTTHSTQLSSLLTSKVD